MNDSYLTISGNVTADPILRKGQAGQYVTFRVASTPRRFDRTRGWFDGDTTFVSVIAFNSLATHIADSVHKGQPVVVHGRLRLNTWSDGARQITSLELQASAVGHNLVFGCSSFVKTAAVQADSGDRMADPKVNDDLRNLSFDAPRDGEPELVADQTTGNVDPWADADEPARLGEAQLDAEGEADLLVEDGYPAEGTSSPWAPFGHDPETDLYVERRAG